MGVAWDVDLDVTEHNGQLAVTSVVHKARWWDSYVGLKATRIEPSRIVFGRGQHVLDLKLTKEDTLELRVRSGKPRPGDDVPTVMRW